MIDGLYLNNTWVAEVDTILTFQANDLQKPDTLNASYSLSFQLPDTLLIRDLLENAEQVDSGGRYPYQTLSARLISQGESVFTGVARLDSFQAGWQVQLLASSKSLYEQLTDKSLRDLDLSAYDHPWTLAGITSFAGATSGVVYPIVDYGNFDSDTFASDALFPSVYAHTLITKMLSSVGYHPAGNWLTEPLVKRIALPFVDDNPQSQDDQWIADRTARVTIGTIQVSAQTYDAILPFSVDNRDEWSDGKKDNFKSTLFAYKCDVAMRLRVQAYQPFTVYVGSGAVESMLIVEKNGVEVAQQYWSVSGPYNITGTKLDSLTLDELITCRAGDQIRIRFRFQKRTTFAEWVTILSIAPDTTWASFTPDGKTYPGDTWLVSRNLPQLSCLDLLKSIALLTGSTFIVDEFRKSVRLIPLSEVIAATPDAVDWSSRVEESEEPQVSVLLEPYGQSNLLRWKQFDFPAELATSSSFSSGSTTSNPRPLGYGDGQVRSPAGNLPASAELFELPFAACQNSDLSLTGYGNPVLIRTRRLSKTGTDGSVSLDQFATTPRLILIESSVTRQVLANLLTPEGVVRKEPVTLTGCWWSNRAAPIQLTTNAFTLAFDPVAPAHREQTLIQRYFSGLKRILRRPRALTVSVSLDPVDIASLDLTKPIRLQKVRAGCLDLNDGYYYLNKINNWSADATCTVTLIPYY